MLFRKPVLERIAAGKITLAFRRWRRPTVRAGGRLRTPAGELAIEAVDEIAIEDIGEQHARSAGYTDRDELVDELSRHGDGRLYRIAFRLVGPDPRVALRTQDRLSAEELAAVGERLAKLDRDAPWTRAALTLIAAHPGMRAEDLAARQGVVKARLKARVRRLKDLGLTESLAVGYRLSQRGAAVLSALAAPRAD